MYHILLIKKWLRSQSYIQVGLFLYIGQNFVKSLSIQLYTCSKITQQQLDFAVKETLGLRFAGLSIMHLSSRFLKVICCCY